MTRTMTIMKVENLLVAGGLAYRTTPVWNQDKPVFMSDYVHLGDDGKEGGDIFVQAVVPNDHADRLAVVGDVMRRLYGLFTGVSNVIVLTRAMGDSFALRHGQISDTGNEGSSEVILDEAQVKERLVKAKLGMWSPMADQQASMFRSLNVVIGRNGSGYTLWAKVSDSTYYSAQVAKSIRSILVRVFADAGNVIVSDTPMGTARAFASIA